MERISKMIANTDNLTMESLALPRDLYWDGKMEPISPLSVELFSMTEPAGFWLNDDENFDKGIPMGSHKDSELKSESVLINGDDFVFEFCDFKEEEWTENKLPLLDVDSAIAHPNIVTKVSNCFDIDAHKSENFEIAVLTTLTPPQSPPQSRTSAIFSQNVSTENVDNLSNVIQHQLLPATPPAIVSQVPTVLATSQIHVVPAATPIAPTPTTLHNLNFAPFYSSTPFTPAAVQTDDDERNSQIVDEFLKSCIKELPNLNDECESMSWSSYSTSSRPDSEATDEDWSPNSSFSSSASSSPIYNGNEDNTQSAHEKSLESPKTKKRTRPYGRGIEDRKIRKKEQNKNAATRYRQKKKVEMENVLNEEQQLTQRNEELKRILAERQREAKYLKTLIKEFYKKKKDNNKANV